MEGGKYLNIVFKLSSSNRGIANMHPAAQYATKFLTAKLSTKMQNVCITLFLQLWTSPFHILVVVPWLMQG